MPHSKQKQKFEPTPFEVILAGPGEEDQFFDADDVSFAANLAARADGTTTAAPTSFDEILTGEVTDDTLLMEFEPALADRIQPRLRQVRAAGRGFKPKFNEDLDEETRFRIFRQPPTIRALILQKLINKIKLLIREREQDGLPPSRLHEGLLEKWEKEFQEIKQDRLF